MRKYLFITITTLILVLIQDSFLWEFLGTEFNPSLIIALCFALIFCDDSAGALFCALVGGLWLDLMGVGIVGLSSFLLLLLLLAAMWIRRSLLRGVWIQILLVIIITIVFKIAMNYPEAIFSWRLLFSGLLNFLIAMLIHYIIGRTRQKYLSFEFRIRA